MTVEYTMEDVAAAGKTALLSFILYLVDPFSMFFTVPLHYQGISRKKYAAVLFSVIAVTLAVALREIVRYRGIALQGEVLVFFTLGFGMPVMLSMVTGAFYLLKPLGFERRLAIVLSTVGLIGVLLIIMYERNSDLASRTSEMLAQSLEMFAPGSLTGPMFNSSQLAAAAIYTFQRSFVLLFFVQFGIGFGAAWEFHKKKEGITDSLLTRLHIREQFIWVLLLSWTVILLDILLGVGSLGIIGWNIGLIAALIYVLRGMAIFRMLLLKRRRTPVSGFQLCILLSLLMFIPGINMLSLLALGILGVTEIWIIYRNE